MAIEIGGHPDSYVAHRSYLELTKQERTKRSNQQGEIDMKNVTITDIDSKGDVDFDQNIDTDTVIAGAGGIAVNGEVSDSVFNTGRNSGIMAGDDVDMEDSIVGNGNTQLNDSEVGAFSGRGNATNVQGENVNMGSGDLIDVDSHGDAQVVTGNGNDVTGDVDVDASHSDGPVNVAVGEDIRQQAQQDNSQNLEDNDTMVENYDYESRQSTVFEDNSRDSADVTLEGDDNEIDLDFD
jgi:hypothetical protein